MPMQALAKGDFSGWSFDEKSYSVLAQSNYENGALFHGSAQIDAGPQYNPAIFTGEVSKVKKGQKIKMSLSNIVSTSYADEDDEFFAQITRDVCTEKGVIIPAGSFAHGNIDQLERAKKLRRDGYVDLTFDYIATPDGRKIPINASMTTKTNAVKAVAKHVAKDAGYMLGGGALGGWMALNMLGLPAAVVTNGGTVAGGAGVGAVAGLTVALNQKGKEVLLTPIDEFSVEVHDILELPVMKKEAFVEKEILHEGLNIKISNFKIEKDPFGQPNVLTLSILIDNQTQKSFSVFDMVLVNDLNDIYYPTPFSNTQDWFNRIGAGDRTSTRLSFSVNNPKRKHWLVVYDTRTRNPLVKISLENAKREILNKQANKK